MAGLHFTISSGEQTTGTTTRTLLQVVAPANQRVLVHRIDLGLKGINPTDSPVLAEVVRQSTAGTSGAVTPVKRNESDAETIQATARNGFSSTEPTTGDVVEQREVHPQGRDVIIFQPPLVVKGGNRLGVRVTAGVSISAAAAMHCEE